MNLARSIPPAFLSFTLLAVFLGCKKDVQQQVKPEEEAAVAIIKRVNGNYVLSKEDKDHPVIFVHLSERSITDQDVAALKDLTMLEDLSLELTNVSGAGLAELKDLKNMKKLRLSKTKIVDADLEYLKGMDKLEYLQLRATEISDAGLLHLKGLKNLRWLDVTESKVTKQGADELKAALPELKISPPFDGRSGGFPMPGGRPPAGAQGMPSMTPPSS